MTDKQNIKTSSGYFGRLFGASISTRIAFASVCIVMLIALLIGSVSHIFIRSYIMERSAVAMEHNAAFARQRLEYSLNAIIHDVSSMSGNLILSNALVDSQGRDIYILPFLKGYKMPEGITFALTLCDFQGMPIASGTKDNPPPYKKPEMLKQTLSKGLPYTEITGDPPNPNLLIAYPVFYGATNKPEGIIVMEICLKDIFDRMASTIGGDTRRSIRITSGDALIWTNGAEKEKNSVMIAKMPNLKEPLKGLNLRIELAERHAIPLRNLYVSFIVIGILTLALTIILSRAIAVRLTKRLVDLSEIADRITESGLPDRTVKVEGSDEIGKLASALNRMLEKLKASHDDLERLVGERTSALKERENFLRTIIETEPECVKLLNPDCALLTMNSAGLSMIEADSLEQVKGKSILPLVAPDYVEAFKRHVEDVFHGRHVTLEFEIIGLKGTRRRLDMHAVPLCNSSNEIIALLGITRDITHRKKTEEKLKDYIQEIERFNRLAVGREERMIELKKEINELLQSMGKEEKYKIAEGGKEV
ncbi:MAG: hypothetical protein A2X55_10265 [Nitrospirae bacterium GWB2_47_37]|nr:MAG: hypothetical protein A2X55_10265 [Nitrospirae bacterium GWB2_47_37]HAK88709.1 hypothetical protein [Nitrospiraceae bacterium]